MTAQPAGMKSSGSRRNVSFGKLRNWQINRPTTFKAKTIEWPEGGTEFSIIPGWAGVLLLGCRSPLKFTRSRRCFMADRIEAQIDEILATCEGDLLGALKALLLVNELLEFELQQLQARGARRRMSSLH